MKKSVLLLLSILTFLTCAAPELSKEQKRDQEESLKLFIKRIAYDKEFNRFIEHLRLKESSNDWKAVNDIGCIGWFQFSQETLSTLGYGYITCKGFKSDPCIFPPELQMKVLQVLIKTNESQLMDFMYYVGKVINGITITRAGLLAGAHLGGAMGVRLYLLSGGRINKQDMNATTIQDYMREFQSYNI
jgi:hypothetical protein